MADYSPYQNKGSGKNSFLPFSIHDRLYRRQGGICKVCNGFIRHHEFLEIHHLLPLGVKERNNMRFIWLIHVSCHDQLHSEGDLSIYGEKDKPTESVDTLEETSNVDILQTIPEIMKERSRMRRNSHVRL